MTATQPEQLALNEFEIAVLDGIGRQDPALSLDTASLHVVSREFTGVGSFTQFSCVDSTSECHVVLEMDIHIPRVPSGLGAVLHCKGKHPLCLEIYTFGDESWDGAYDGFSIRAVI
jgi:hypothetical protein